MQTPCEVTIPQYQIKKIIVDTCKIPVYADGMPEYIKDTWFPTVSKLGLKFIAFIVPAAAIGKMSQNRAHANTETIAGISVAHFSEFEEGLNWLKSS